MSHNTYATLWARTPGRVLYILAVFILAMTAVSVLASLFWTGVGLLILIVGVPIVVGSLFVARGFAVADRFLLGLTGLPEVSEPLWSRDAVGDDSFWRVFSRPLRSAHYWVALVHGMIVSPIVSTITFVITTVWVSVALGGLTYWFWGLFLPTDADARWGEWVADRLPAVFGEWSPASVEALLSALAGLLCAITLPWVMAGLAHAHHSIVTAMLGRWRSDDLADEVRAESVARDAAVQAEDAALRRLERDIHDGPQQTLVRLQMDLASLERRLDAGDTDAAAELARDSRSYAKSALEELRALSSGVAPPLLQDRGLAASLEAIAQNTAIHVHSNVDPDVDAVAAPEIARAIYFFVAELLTNAVKHSLASAITLQVGVRAETATQRWIDVWVVDNGRGGAVFRSGHGLEGLRGRAAGLRGILTLTSPLGGPTTVGVHIPLAAPPQARTLTP
ncbi:sensor histidine kinase [Microbacterium sp. C7(2022)]|uniref:sensor histidine kinase n=1 Tax=Microbacterium sp. C7(2022) TaxID=2992759 RepID=UPI00237B3C73|nr:sensor histidine kinase [Microbacterium sp. C7(2022)]MDE0546961.1 sensor domain-containing protein [Microbacterium sp. C7(2022)]